MSRIILDSLSQLPDFLKALNISKPLTVTSGRWLNTLRPVLSPLFSPAVIPVFSAFSPNPDFDACAAGLCMLERKGCDGLIAVGGGSAMDTAKAIKAMYLSPTPADALNMRLGGTAPLPLILIPTTAGSGSEATQTAVVYVDGAKFSLSHPGLMADGVILDPAFLRTLPAAQRRSCALDALCQAIESYWSRAASPASRLLAGPAVSGIASVFPAYMAGDAAAEKAMLHWSYQAGEAIQLTRTTAAHAMSYQLTKRLGIPHGDACALTLPYLWQRLLGTPAVQALASLLQLAAPEDGPVFFLRLCRRFGLTPPGLPDPELLEELVNSVNVERLNNHPESLTREDIREIYRLALARGEEAP